MGGSVHDVRVQNSVMHGAYTSRIIMHGARNMDNCFMSCIILKHKSAGQLYFSFNYQQHQPRYGM